MYGGSDKVLYPMLGVGAFFTMFWTGVVVGHELGMACLPLLMNGMLFGCAGTLLVVKLERRASTRPPGPAPRHTEPPSTRGTAAVATGRSPRLLIASTAGKS